MVDIPEVVICTHFGDYRLRDFWVAVGQISPFPINFECPPYKTLALPCECVIGYTWCAVEPQGCGKYCNEYVCLVVRLSVCLSTCISRKPHGRTSPNCLCMLHMALAQFFSGGVAIRYVFPVLWMTSCFHTKGSMAHYVYF